MPSSPYSNILSFFIFFLFHFNSTTSSIHFSLTLVPRMLATSTFLISSISVIQGAKNAKHSLDNPSSIATQRSTNSYLTHIILRTSDPQLISDPLLKSIKVCLHTTYLNLGLLLHPRFHTFSILYILFSIKVNHFSMICMKSCGIKIYPLTSERDIDEPRVVLDEIKTKNR